jgi:uncharacterized protein
MMRRRFYRASLWAALGCTGLIVLLILLNGTALPAIVDLRPMLLVTSGLAILLTAVGYSSANPLRMRIVSGGAAILCTATLLITAYDVTLRYRTEEVEWLSADATLRGSLYLPRSRGPHPAIVLVHGSGSQARDATAFYARAYARRGIVALSYDKRGSGISGDDFRTATYQQLALDVQKAVELLRIRPEVDPQRVGIWGLSEGEWVGLLAAVQTDPRFLVLVSPSAMTPSQQVQYETAANVRKAGFSEEAAQQAAELYGKLAAFQRTGSGRDELNRELERARHQEWFGAARYLERSVPEYDSVRSLAWFPAWHERMDFDPLPLLSQLRCPVLAQIGGNDPKNDGAGALRRIEKSLAKAGNPDFTGVLYPKATHNIIEWRLPRAMPPPWFATNYLSAQLDWVAKQVFERKE